MNKIANFFLKHQLIILLFFLGLLLRLIAIYLDPFLHPWDERFHALVARNMMDQPLVPILRVNPISDNYDPFIWCCNHIWLHKQPLFLWQMALSMKIFGVSVYSMRLPSAIMGAILVPVIYKVVLNLKLSKRIALFTALMLAFSGYHLKIIGGLRGMDHNDVAHGFYVLMSIWALTEYIKTKKWYWWVFIGLFSGAAILVKWLTGLLVFLVWGLYNLFSLFQKESIRPMIIPFLSALIICVIVFLPWQLYIMHHWPELAKYEYDFNRRHITEALEGHEGDAWFYINYFSSLIGYFWFLIPIGFLISFRNKTVESKLNFSIILATLLVFCFYSFVVTTKVDTYLYFIVPLLLIYIAFVFDSLIHLVQSRLLLRVFMMIAVVMMSYYSLGINWFVDYLSNENKERQDRIYNATIYKTLKNYMPDDIDVVMNMNSFEDIDVMFFNQGVTAYHWTLGEEDFKNLEKSKTKVAVFQPHGHYDYPDYVKNYPYLYIIKIPLKSFYE